MKNFPADNVVAKYDVDVFASNKKSNKYVVICHGFGGPKITYDKYDVLFDVLLKKYNLVSFSFSGCKDGDLSKMDSVVEWVCDLKNIVGYIREMEKDAEIVLFGISMGAWVSTLYCCSDPEIVKNICIGPVFTLHTGMKMHGGVALHYLLSSGISVFNDKEVSTSFLKSLIQNQPVNMMLQGKYDTETAIFAGECDNIFRKTDALIANDIMKEKSSFHEIKKGMHFINNAESIHSLTKFIVKTLGQKNG